MKKTLQYSLLILAFLTGGVAYGQKGTFSGQVKDDEGKVISGATIKTQNGGDSTTTDASGKFVLQLTEGRVGIVASALGYEVDEFFVNIKKDVNTTRDIQLVKQTKSVGDVVIIGYGTSTKRELTGSVSSLKGAEIRDMPSQSFEAAIQGKAAGVQITTGSGVAGSGTLVRVRGVASISAAGDPLYVVDGIPISQNYFVNGNNGGFNNNPLATLNPEDIESIDILKDAAATSIYGSRGANGVVLITTKRANKNGLKFDFTTRFGTSQATFTLKC